MKCNSLVLLGWKSLKSKQNKRNPAILATISSEEASTFIGNEFEKKILSEFNWIKPELFFSADFCKGNIKTNIVLDEDSFFGGTTFVIEVEYKCDNCGHSSFPHLPQTEVQIAKLVTNIIRIFTDKELNTLMKGE